jgi:perosamine synthetase
MQVFLSRPDITDAEIQAVTDVLRSPNLALGPKMREFEEKMAAYAGRKHAIAVNSGTSGLFLCFKALNIGPGDEVITTPFTFIASVNSIIMAGAKPVFVDIDPENLNIDPEKIEAAITPRTKAIEPVIIFGNPARIDEVCDIAKKHKLAVVEDSCEGVGSVYKGKKVGTFGTMSNYAFYPNKQLTTGEGGIILTDDDDLADMCCSLRNQGRGKGGGWLAHERLGYNYRLPDINCALGIVQLSRLEEIKAKRARVASWYQELLADEKRITVPYAPADSDMSWFVFVIRLEKQYNQTHKESLMQKLIDNGVQVSNYFPPVHLQPFIAKDYGLKVGDFPITESVCQRTIALPFYNNLPREQVEYVCQTLKKCLDQL